MPNLYVDGLSLSLTDSNINSAIMKSKSAECQNLNFLICQILKDFGQNANLCDLGGQRELNTKLLFALYLSHICMLFSIELFLKDSCLKCVNMFVVPLIISDIREDRQGPLN